MTRTLRMLLFIGAICAATAHAQGLAQLRMEVDAKLEASRKALREAMINLREIRLRSCKLGQAADCELVTLIDVELALLDIETKYQRASRGASPPSDIEKYSKAKEAAEEARSKVSELIDLLK